MPGNRAMVSLTQQEESGGCPRVRRRIVPARLWLMLLGVALVGLGLALDSAAVRADQQQQTYLPLISKATQPTPTFAERVVVLVNQERTSRGLSALSVASELTNAAQAHSQDMATHDFMSHTGSDGSTLGERLTRAGYAWWTCGENVAAGYTTPEQVVAGWMGSEGHRDNILNPDFKDIGCGYAYGTGTQYGHYWTLDLGARR